MTVSTESRSTGHVGEEFAGDRPLVAIMRGLFVGSLHRGTAAVVGCDGEVRFALGDIDQPVFLRSAAKPFQAMPAVLAGAIERFGLDERELAVMCASHSGEPRHQDAVLSILRKIGLDERALHCGVHPPIHGPTASEQQRHGVEPTTACNNCSGAHAGMLAACRANGWPVESYGSPDHPLQREIFRILLEFADLGDRQVGLAGDNCHVPTFRMPVRAAALAFARLATGAEVRPELAAAAGRISSAMISHPEMVGGDARFDSDLMAAAGGRVVAKGGAEAFQGVGARAGAGLAIKVSDGNPRAIPPAVLPILEALELLPVLEALNSYRTPDYRDLEGDVVGRAVPVFAVAVPQ
jgi:L-asparaginase II